ncbi:MAG: class I SAM-dependent methyltransferase [Lewinella sp.]
MIKVKHPNSKHYNWLVYRINHKIFHGLSNHLKGTLYDFGCGEKPYRPYIEQFVDEYIGIDWSNTAHNSKADIIADLNKPLSVADGVADSAISISVMEHLSEPSVFLSEAYRLLRPNGTFVMQVPFQWHIHEAPYDFYRYTPYGLKHLFQKAGFQEVEIVPCGGFFSTMALKLNYFSLRFIKGPQLLKSLVKLLLFPFWYLTQLSAILLDVLDRNQTKETIGYWVVARKA